MKCYFYLLVLLFSIVHNAASQTTQFKYRVMIKSSQRVMELVPEPGSEKIILHKGDVIKSEHIFNVADTAYTVTNRVRVIPIDSMLHADKSRPKLRQLKGWANLSFDKDDPSRLNINYWTKAASSFRIGQHFIIKGKTFKDTILLEDASFQVEAVPKGKYVDFFFKMKHIDTLNDIIANNLKNIKSNPGISNIQYIRNLKESIADIRSSIVDDLWMDYADEIFFSIPIDTPALQSGADPMEYALKNADTVYARRYSANPYFIKFENREYDGFRFKCWEMGALTIPFKLRFGYSKSGKPEPAPSQFLTDLNVGTYIGYTFGVVRYNYTKDEDNQPRKRMVSFGGFFNLSRIELNKDNTHLADKPLTSDRQVAALSPGFAVMSSLYDFRFGLFLGMDIALGGDGAKWDYNRKLWIGIGFGYNIGLIWKPTN